MLTDKQVDHLKRLLRDFREKSEQDAKKVADVPALVNYYQGKISACDLMVFWIEHLEEVREGAKVGVEKC